LIQLLEQHGLNVLCASDGSTGVLMARELKPDLIVLDIQMPEMNGLDACRAIKSDPATQEIPIIFLTAHDQAEYLREGLGSGAIDFIPKDAFSNIVLLKTLDQLGVTSISNPEEEA
jgi:CheY-like chemotaxis protein